MTDALSDPILPVEYDEVFREYSISECGDSSIMQLFSYCPWCGTRLPMSLRDAWFDRLDDLGLEPGDSGIPENMTSSQWWIESGL